MHIGRVSDCTRVLGKSQGYTGLPVRDEAFDLGDGQRVHAMRSAWFPSSAELERLAAGAPIHLVLLAREHPPVLLEVGDPPEDN